ncbi:cytochrome-b5 reductase [Malassezia vespertilionis]|uniref:NADH-cytochrome b5 reductase n=1 Tax=Malassezia vespertilionis TaxID=2020962 RepID=A0A2N1JDC5_9BASI|nr:cytochrome-b5 reductase [Malassezia vespertilionis]PKI84543.1 Mcr1p [Malassezia vespertilionis]WFD06573.1 cytochrome-b5 reductase [Malassezia vespertilionis]
MLFRSAISTSCSAARSALRKNALASVNLRQYSATPKAPSSNVGLYFALGGVAGIAAWYSMGGFNGNMKLAISQVNADSDETALSSSAFNALKLLEVKPYNHDSSIYVFELPDNKRSGVFVASAILVRGAEDEPKDGKGNPVFRPYTPISAPETKGIMELLIKHYPNGKMTEYLKTLKPGDQLRVKGPLPKFEYKPNEFDHIGLIAGGSGITPIWQLISRIASNPDDKTKATVLYGNKAEEDILLRDKFDSLNKDPRFTIVHYLDNAPPNWQGGKGNIGAKDVQEKLPKPTENTKIFVCGPPGLMNAVSGAKKSVTDQGPLVGVLAESGFKAEQVFKF